jgi:hypothetical protein
LPRSTVTFNLHFRVSSWPSLGFREPVLKKVTFFCSVGSAPASVLLPYSNRQPPQTAANGFSRRSFRCFHSILLIALHEVPASSHLERPTKQRWQTCTMLSWSPSRPSSFGPAGPGGNMGYITCHRRGRDRSPKGEGRYCPEKEPGFHRACPDPILPARTLLRPRRFTETRRVTSPTGVASPLGCVLFRSGCHAEGGGEVLSGHRGNDGEVDTHAPVSVARAPRDKVE